MSNETFQCDCKGPVKTLVPDKVLHACRNKYAPLTSYFDGVERWASKVRVQVNPQLTGGEIRYNWFQEYR